MSPFYVTRLGKNVEDIVVFLTYRKCLILKISALQVVSCQGLKLFLLFFYVEIWVTFKIYSYSGCAQVYGKKSLYDVTDFRDESDVI